MTLGEVTQVLEGRAFAILTVVLGLPNCLPMLPPIPFLCGLLLLFVALQMVYGRRTPWLPRRLRERSVDREQAANALNRAVPLFRRLEQWSRPRFAFMQTPWALRVIGVLLATLSFSLLWAIPFVGQIPLGFAICLVGLGLVEKDGAAIVAGVLVGLMGITATLFSIYALIIWILEQIRIL
jgi:hypothetical protein